ncbi:hypothetical protein CJD36_000755 [Flavipsychrobacter stenotrophus]|uniref:Uncharacterized protein n=1 Tax=Flavipsychrobacter stenotrophus TaxID=2077091 RepID=A0A2S7T0C0_9BACT|nr:hypothetical protein [Flavipsychrobacter stenotrophus]PQJ12321.1 hypothetical protein CJD36_000755 [Flavipsychrobacter stenotrophus]
MMIQEFDLRDNLITVRYFYNGAIITLASIDSDAKLLAMYSDVDEAVANEMKMLKDGNDGKEYYLDVTNNDGHKVIVSHSEIIK